MDEQMQTRVTRFLERLTELSRAYGLQISGYYGIDVEPFDSEEVTSTESVTIRWDEETCTYIRAKGVSA